MSSLKQMRFSRIVLMVVVLVSFAFAWAANGSSIHAAGAPERYSDLIARAGQIGTVRLLVTLNVPFTPEGNLSNTQKQAQRNTIQQTQNALLSRMQGLKYELIANYRLFPITALNADQTALIFLANAPEVKNIEEDIPMAPDDAASNAVVGVPAAQALGFDGAGYAVAILDTGVQVTHPFFAGRIGAEACFSTTVSGQSTSVCPNGQSTSGGNPGQAGVGAGANCPITTYGCEHGTHVAGIAAGRNYAGGPGYDGIARSAKVIALQVFSQFNSSANCGTNPVPCVLSYSSDQLAALQYLASTIAPGLPTASANMSLGGSTKFTAFCDTNSLKPAVDTLRSLGIATVISSGNNGFADGITAPACISTAISVGATDNSDAIASFSNRASFMSLYAPGSGIDSSVPNNYFAVLSGTSMSAPAVTGAWAVLKSKQNADVATILTAFQNTGVNIPNTGGPVFSNKRIQIDAALGQLNPTPTPSYTPGGPTLTVTPSLTNTPTSTPTGLVGTYTVTNLNDSGAGSLRAAFISAGSGSTINFQAGLTGTITLQSEITYTGSITVNGPGARVITVSGNNANRIFNFKNASTSNVVNISGLTLANGLNIYGGVALNLNGGTVVLDGLAILNNAAGPGTGAAFFNADANVTLKNSTVAGNTSTNRGAIQNQGGASTSLTIINSTFVNNTAGAGLGGAIRNFNTLKIVNSTFVNNTASDAQVSNNGGTVTIQNSAFYAGTQDDIRSTSAVASLDYNIINKVGTATFSGTTTNNQLNVNPNLQTTLANNGGQTDTLLPNAGSPVLDKIPAASNCNTSDATLATDQRGVARPFNVLCDIGAVEVNGALSTATSSPTPSNTPTASPTPFTVTYNGTLLNGGPTFNNPNEGTPPTSLSTNGTAVYYHVQSFTVPVAGSYSLQQTVASYTDGSATNQDGYFSLYQISFNPATPLVNALSVNDDGPLQTLNRPGLVYTLATGTTYILVTSHYDNGFYGTFTNTIAGPGLAVLGSTATATPTATVTATASNTPVPVAADHIGVYKNGVFSLRNTNTSGAADITAVFGGDPSDLPIVGDWNADGVDTVGVYRNSTGVFFLSNSNTSPAVNVSLVFGNPSDTPLHGHWTNTLPNDGVGVYRNSNGILYQKNALTTGFSDYFAIFGNPGDQGIAGDWNNNGFDSIGIYRSTDQTWYLSNNSTPSGITFADLSFVWNIGTNAPVTGDWDADGVATVGYFNGTNGVFALHSTLAAAGSDNVFAFGPTGGIPVAGHWQAGTVPPLSGVIRSGGSSGGVNPVDPGHAD
jgi:subtilisin family serine protease